MGRQNAFQSANLDPQMTSCTNRSTPTGTMGDPEKAQSSIATSSVGDCLTLTLSPPSSSSPASVSSIGTCQDVTFEHTYPDGGLRAWLTVLGSAAFLFCCGQLTAFGVFETWYSEHQLQSVSPSTISWIGSIQLWVLYFSVCTLRSLAGRTST